METSFCPSCKPLRIVLLCTSPIMCIHCLVICTHYDAHNVDECIIICGDLDFTLLPPIKVPGVAVGACGTSILASGVWPALCLWSLWFISSFEPTAFSVL